ncbi:MAG: hypothetical protein PHC45_03000 [Clostridiaceae bacterium]|nr:hypothetical protein [Clostridiaceae bacterium]
MNICSPEGIRKTADSHNVIKDILIGKSFEKEKYNSKLIGVFGESGKSILVEMLQSVFNRRDDSRMKLGIMPIAINTSENILFYLENMSFDSVILTDSGNKPAADIISGFSEKVTVIMNNDEYQNINRFITYGLNQKAVVTASSIDVDEITCFNYCVQKSFYTGSGKKIDPFEVPVHLHILGGHSIYYALAAITCGLYYDIDIKSIKESIEDYKTSSRHLEKIYEGDFTVIDDYCKSVHDYTTAFDSIQILNYDNLILVISVTGDMNPGFHEEKAVLIAEWVKILKCKKVILTNCMDRDSNIGELPLKSIRIYKKVFEENDVSFRYYHLLHYAVEKGLSLLNSNDLMVLLGSEEMNAASSIVNKLLGSVKKKKN